MSGDAVSFKGIVISSEEYGDNDRLLTILTGTRGSVTVLAKGVAKKNSKHAFLCMSFMLCDFTVNASNGYFYLKEADIIENNAGITVSLEATTVAFHIAELVRYSSYDNMSTDDLYELTNYAYYHLSRCPQDYKIVYAAFNWRFLYQLGFNNTYNCCDLCGKEFDIKSDSVFVDTVSNKILCFNCVNRKILDKYFALSHVSVTALNYFIISPYKRLFNVRAESNLLDSLMQFTTVYLAQAMEHEVKTLETLKKLDNPFEF